MHWLVLSPSKLCLALLVLRTSALQLAQNTSFVTLSPEFKSILGDSPSITLLFEDPGRALFHEAAIYHPPTQALFVSSNQLDTNSPSPDTNNKEILISRITGLDSASSIHIENISSPQIPLANGGVRYTPFPDGSADKLLWCAQGSLAASPPAGIVSMDATPPYATASVVSSYYGTPFNAPNDVVVSRDGAVWFTDPIYGALQGVRPAPQLPNQVYYFDAARNSTRAVADGFVRPNGLAFGVGERELYVTDTGSTLGDGTEDPQGPASIYAFDVAKDADGGIFLENRRLFALATAGIPDGVKVDAQGHVYAGVGDGVAVWNAAGDLIGKIAIEGGCSKLWVRAF